MPEAVREPVRFFNGCPGKGANYGGCEDCALQSSSMSVKFLQQLCVRGNTYGYGDKLQFSEFSSSPKANRFD
jgi:hypothetical protein